MHEPRRQEWYVTIGNTTWSYWLRWPRCSPIPCVLAENGYSIDLPPIWLELGTFDHLTGPAGTPQQMRDLACECFGRWLRIASALHIICSHQHARAYRMARRMGYDVQIVASGLSWHWQGVDYEDDCVVQIRRG